MLAKFKEWCFHTATLWGLGEWYGGGIVGSALAIPILIMFKGIAALNKDFFVILSVTFIVMIMLIIQMALRFHTDQFTSTIILDRILGLYVAFLGNPLTIKFFIVGFILFHFFVMIRPFLFNRVGPINLQYLPGALGVVISAVLAGFFVNGFFKIVLWLVY